MDAARTNLPMRVIGVTGHRTIDPNDAALREIVARELGTLGGPGEAGDLILLSSLAEGADRHILGADCTLPGDIDWENIRTAIAAAHELAACAEDKGLTDDYITPTMDEWEVFPREAVAVGMKAIEQGIARFPISKDELLEKSSAIIRKVESIPAWWAPMTRATTTTAS